jgi:hypothetical protein
MNAASKLYIPLVVNGKKYYITVEREDNYPHKSVYWSYGEEFTNPMDSFCAFADTPELALMKFILLDHFLI